MTDEERKFLIGVVGPCGSGKSTLIAGLEKRGYRCRHIAQEHSYVKTMWRVVAKPDILIYLECSFENSTTRRKLNWLPEDHQEQLRRLSHAREHAQIIIDTNPLSPAEVLWQALAALKNFTTNRTTGV
ncbi:MAG: AAA family ATPase [Chloroflexi bacterium]|nr:AAA family ATPase [Chloroflexota bacterium]